ncbi:MAG: sterol desaturase family protein [Leadbetterella sp.]
MMKSYEYYILNQAHPLVIYAITLVYFCVLYFGLGALFSAICTYLEHKKIVQKINIQALRKNQISFEIRNSIVSIFVFGFSGFPILYMINSKLTDLSPNTFQNIGMGLVILTLWNEVHFFVIHRMMHLPFFMKKVHHVHHFSSVPTVYSVYSFHWIEALLLSTVPVSIAPFVDFSTLTFALYPLVSILINFSGHCNYRFGNGEGDGWLNFGTNHNKHHRKGIQHYGFLLNTLDVLSSKLFSNHNIKKHE